MSKTPLDRVWYFLQQWDQGQVLAKAGHVPLNYDDVGSLAETVKASSQDQPSPAELVTDVTDEDVREAMLVDEERGGNAAEGMRAALEAYGARLVARMGRTS